MKPLVIYHGGECTDGFGAAFAAWLKLGDSAEYLPMEYGATYNFDLSGVVVNHVGYEINGREVFILDFSFPKEVMDDIFAHAKRVVWLDHHKTAFEMWGVQPGQRVWAETEGRHVKLHMDKSGAMLAWEYFHPGKEVPMLIQHIDDRDRWQFKLDGSRELHAALRSYEPWTFEQWLPFLSNAHWDNKTQVELAIEEGAAILRAHNKHIQAALKQARACRLLKSIPKPGGEHWEALFSVNASGLAANAPSFLASDLGHELANKSGTFGLVWSMADDMQVHCSLRSNGEYDVGAIAKAFGGGGHRNAAGFSTNINTLSEWLK